MNSNSSSFSYVFLFRCNGREGGFLRTVHYSYRGALGAAPPQWGNVEFVSVFWIVCMEKLPLFHLNNKFLRFFLDTIKDIFLILTIFQWADSSATYAYSCCIWPWPLEFFIVLWIENNKKFQQANATAIRVCCKWIDPNFVSGSFLVCVLPGPICIKEVQTYETKRLTRLSVYVERKNVCKWSLVYLQAGKFLWSFLLTQFFLTFCRVSVQFFP